MQLLNTFFRGIALAYQISLDSASDGNFKTWNPEEAVRLIENLASNNSTNDMILTTIKVQSMRARHEPAKPLIMVWFNEHFQSLIGLICEVLDREKLLDFGQHVEAFN